jgi:hypothetical protein
MGLFDIGQFALILPDNRLENKGLIKKVQKILCFCLGFA